jgi:hypothetical protein
LRERQDGQHIIHRHDKVTQVLEGATGSMLLLLLLLPDVSSKLREGGLRQNSIAPVM